MRDPAQIAATCQTCGSNRPHKHPAMSFGGEVELCVDDYHLTQTNQNRPAYIKAVMEKRRMKAMAEQTDGE